MKNVALIDDDSFYSLWLSKKLHPHGIDVEHFETVSDFVENERDREYEAILVDLNMADSSGVCWKFAGLEAIKTIRRETQTHAPIGILTGQPNFLVSAASRQNGAEIYLEKDESAELIATALNGINDAEVVAAFA